MIIFACILLFFIILLTLKCTLTLKYDDELSLTLRILFFKFRLLPAKKKKYPHSMSARKARRIRKKLRKQAQKKRDRDAEKKKEQAKKEDEKGKKKRSVREILDIVSLVIGVLKAVLKKTFGHLRLKMTRVKIKIATGDAATTAIAYGAVSQSINVLFAILSEVKKVALPKDDELDVSADFLADECELDIDVSFSLRVWHILHVAFAALIELVRRMLDKEKKKAEKEHLFPQK